MTEQTIRGLAARRLRAAVHFITALLAGLVGVVWSLLRRGLVFTEHWLAHAKRAVYGIAVTRMLLALTGIGMLVCNFSTRLYTFGTGSAWNGEAARPRSMLEQIWLFSLFHRLALHDVGFTLAYLALLLLAVMFLLGWRTKIVLPLFFVLWVSFAEMNDLVGDQGDNMYRIVLLSLLFADPSSRWSLDARRRRSAANTDGGWARRAWSGIPIMPAWLTNIMHNLVLVSMTCHVCFVYASGALYKASGTPWQAGYAIYNPLHTARFGPWPELSDLLGSWGPAVTAMSWSSIILQMSFPMMLLNRVTRVIGLIGILSFHIGIAILLGLPWFSLAMIAVDSIFIRTVTWRRMARFARDAWSSAQERASGQAERPTGVAVTPAGDGAAVSSRSVGSRASSSGTTRSTQPDGPGPPPVSPPSPSPSPSPVESPSAVPASSGNRSR